MQSFVIDENMWKCDFTKFHHQNLNQDFKMIWMNL